MEAPHDVACQKMSIVRDAVAKLITKQVEISVYAGESCCTRSGRSCLHAKWGRGPHPQCPLHRLGHRTTQHDCVVRDIVDRVCELDADVAVLPSFGMKGPLVSKNRGPAFYIDTLFVLSNGTPVAVEVDGRSHQNPVNKEQDALKGRMLRKCRIHLLRVDLSLALPPQLYELEQSVAGLL